ncbi:MAG: CAP domain-containing protein, partial [bacterium]|nr:CAP domain-containing protein [bacterium]
YLFLSHHSNNQRAKILHPSGMGMIIAVLLAANLFFRALPIIGPAVLGVAADIKIEELLQYTNEERGTAGVSSVKLDSVLAEAARKKGEDMLRLGYWAHISPEGKEPWVFITEAGYGYVYAGENLARDFRDASSVVKAWMNSPSHKANMLNGRYKDIGFAVVSGNFRGYETTLVVQMFGTKGGPQVIPEEAVSVSAPFKPAPAVSPVLSETVVPAKKPIIDPFTASRALSLFLVIILLGVLGIDVLIVWHRGISRASSHSLAHLIYFSVVFAALWYTSNIGAIL